MHEMLQYEMFRWKASRNLRSARALAKRSLALANSACTSCLGARGRERRCPVTDIVT